MFGRLLLGRHLNWLGIASVTGASDPATHLDTRRRRTSRVCASGTTQPEDTPLHRTRGARL
ncbi:hypothetical protein [Streptomyces hebeiensis]|uniref:hypothetical protein n=1 Tax=Streptomyces hebeiensis TaxID=229486 RepID=UPI0031D16FDE